VIYSHNVKLVVLKRKVNKREQRSSFGATLPTARVGRCNAKKFTYFLNVWALFSYLIEIYVCLLHT